MAHRKLYYSLEQYVEKGKWLNGKQQDCEKIKWTEKNRSSLTLLVINFSLCGQPMFIWKLSSKQDRFLIFYRSLKAKMCHLVNLSILSHPNISINRADIDIYRKKEYPLAALNLQVQ